MKKDQRLLEWPQGRLTRAPFRVMSDPEIYAQEQARIFRGPIWNYLCLEAEIADPASYRKLRGVPFENGVAGKGGIPKDFDLAHHRVLHNNWKLYMENSPDSYHATILHTFYATFKLNRLTMDGGVTMDHDGWHSINYSKGATFREGGYEPGIRSVIEDAGLADPSLIERRQEFDDGITVAIQSIFPSCVHQQIYNTLALRQLVPQGPAQSELHWTFFGYKDDDPALRQMRLKQSNLIGPAGYVSIDDGVIAENVQRGIAGKGIEASAVMECRSRGMMQDRVTGLRRINFYEPPR